MHYLVRLIRGSNHGRPTELVIALDLLWSEGYRLRGHGLYRALQRRCWPDLSQSSIAKLLSICRSLGVADVITEPRKAPTPGTRRWEAYQLICKAWRQGQPFRPPPHLISATHELSRHGYTRSAWAPMWRPEGLDFDYDFPRFRAARPHTQMGTPWTS